MFFENNLEWQMFVRSNLHRWKWRALQTKMPLALYVADGSFLQPCYRSRSFSKCKNHSCYQGPLGSLFFSPGLRCVTFGPAGSDCALPSSPHTTACECPMVYKSNTCPGSWFYSEDLFPSQWIIGEIVAKRYTLSSVQAACMAYILGLFVYRHLSVIPGLYSLMSIPSNFLWLCTSRQ